ncbi:MAG: glycoside hydrolase family 88 protein [Verrucomicrobiae bacterium]
MQNDPGVLGSRVLGRVLEQGPAALGWDWGSGLLGHALLGQEAGRKDILRFLRDWVDRHLAAGTTVADSGGILWKLGVGTAVLGLQRERSAPRYARRIREMLAYAAGAPRFACGLIASKADRPEVWVDSLMTLCPFLARAGTDGFLRDGGRAALAQLALHAAALQDPSSGLWFHAGNVKSGRRIGQLWSRGNGWAIFGMVETLELFPGILESAPVRRALRRTVEGLLAAQSADGSWHTVLDRPETFVETSGQAMLVHGLAKAARIEALPARLIRRAREAAWQGWIPLSGHVSDSGEVTGTSIGTAALNLNHYATRPTATWPVWGPAATLLAAGELARPDAF